MLDPWLRRTLERQVTTASKGYYQLQIGELKTSLWHRSLTLRGLRLRSAATPANHSRLPRLRADVELVRLQGIGLLALLRRKEVPLDTVLVQNARLGVGKMPPRSPGSSKALHEQLPLQMEGIRVENLVLINLGGNYSPAQQPIATLRRADLIARDILISAAGAQDSQRLGYARSLAFHLANVEGQARQHKGSFGALRFSTDRQRLELDSLRVQPVQNTSTGSAPRLTLALPRLRLTGLKAMQLARQQLQADSLILTAPDVTFIASTSKQPTKTKAIHEQLPPWLRRCVLRYVALSGGQMRLPGLSVAPVVRAIEVKGNDLWVDSLSALDTKRIFYARAWRVSTGPATGLIDAPYYRARYEKLVLDTSTGLAQADGLTLTPTMSTPEFALRKAQSVPRMVVQIPQLRLAGLDYGLLAREGNLVAGLLELRNPRFQVTSNANYPQPARPSSVTPEQLQKLPFRLNVALARIVNFNFRSAEIVKGGSVPGIFTLTRFNASITHLTNVPAVAAAHPSIGRVSGWLQDKCLVEGVFRFNLRDPQGGHSFTGSFGPAPFAILNSVSEPAAFIRFDKGRVERILCKVQFTKQGANGTLWARYSDLKVSLLKKKPGPDKKNLLTRAGSLLTNTFIVRDNNPRKPSQRLEPGPVQIDRDLRYSVFRVWRVAVVDGMLSSFGVPEVIADKVE
ncbi:hypothetical protein GCM10011375_24660 [Hymenobacter qilianensis]|uniref:Uncharacterized protein n=1 Tax=Hymenobacter qilianensis TaxID=1385715 RepID=A0ACB5PSV1_9BACT|nr:hypothetical protein GCM10011375_24660 [Hymenobacter qilianensis]